MSMPFSYPSSFEPSASSWLAPAVLPLALSRVPNDPAGNTILGRVFDVNAPPVHALYILWPRAGPRDFAPPPGRLHPHPPEPAPSGHHRRCERQSPGPVRYADRPTLPQPEFRFLPARPPPTAPDGALRRPSPL